MSGGSQRVTATLLKDSSGRQHSLQPWTPQGAEGQATVPSQLTAGMLAPGITSKTTSL